MKTSISPRCAFHSQMVFLGTLFLVTSAQATDFSGSLKEVTITDALNANVPPVVQVATTVTGSTVTLDASGTTDSDGSIAEYKWDFGDGSSATGVTATHQFSNNSASVMLTVTDNNGGVAIKQITLALYAESFDTIVDDADATNFTTVGSWPNSTYNTDYYGTGYKYSTKGDGTAKATWTITVPTDGNYTLYTYKSAASSNRSSNAPFEIVNNGTSLGTVLVNQQVGSKIFFSLGAFTLQKGTVTIVLSSASDGYVIADAVKATYNP
nr:PKD domain-containing protein [uncultured Desulfobulbus sp.]